jgi:hypothetical protein
VDAPRRPWWVVAAAVAVALVALAAVGRPQGSGWPSGATRSTAASTDGIAAASGLRVAGRVRLPGQPAAVAVGEGVVWVLLDHGVLLRVDPDRHQVTGRVQVGGQTATRWPVRWPWGRARCGWGCGTGATRRPRRPRRPSASTR